VMIPASVAVFLMICAFTTAGWIVILAGGLSVAAAPVWAFHRPMLMDYYPPGGRVRAFSLHRAGAVIGLALGTVAVVLLVGVWGLAWRGVFVVFGAVFLVLVLIGSRIKEPHPGRFDTERVRAAVREQAGGSQGEAGADEPDLGFFEVVRRLFVIPTVRRIFAAMAVLGAVLYPLNTFLSFHLQERWNLGISGRALFYAGSWLFALPALAWFGKRGEALFASDPALLLRRSAQFMLALAVMLITAVLLPFLPAALVCFGIVYAISAVLSVAISVVLLTIVRPYFRPMTSALSGIFLIGVGGQMGALLLGGLDKRFGTIPAIGVLAGPAIFASWMLVRASWTVNESLDHMLGEVIEDEQVSLLKKSNAHLPLLACRHVNFSYGQLQVLFDVDFTVDEGEMVALLGTNGAGKSTLLRVISGLGLPSSGSVYFQGENITYMDAERRLALGENSSRGPSKPGTILARLTRPSKSRELRDDLSVSRETYGITQIPGGRAVFGQMTVVENLKVLGFMLGRNRKTVDSAIERSLEAFPRLYERRDSKAVTLSGGEQQMLGLSKALMLRPKLLLIDELSLGLAPVLIAELLGMVKQINQEGSAVVLVEQSVNIALSLVHHAYFMEKGEIRFDGPARDLLQRGDLLRAVFLEGTSAAR